MEYQVFESTDREDLETIIDGALGSGYKLHGSLVINANALSGVVTFYQAMIKD